MCFRKTNNIIDFWYILRLSCKMCVSCKFCLLVINWNDWTLCQPKFYNKDSITLKGNKCCVKNNSAHNQKNFWSIIMISEFAMKNGLVCISTVLIDAKNITKPDMHKWLFWAKLTSDCNSAALSSFLLIQCQCNFSLIDA